MKILKKFIPILALTIAYFAQAQISPGVYIAGKQGEAAATIKELKVTDNYLIHTVYESSPANFIKTSGGYYTLEGEKINVALEFNSDYEADGLRKMSLAYKNSDDGLIIDGLTYVKQPSNKQDLDGQWLFGTRGPDTGQERRDDSKPRKTLKFLLDGHFQWIAYHTETFKFSGTGGGLFTSDQGKYIENIGFFSRDDSRVGAKLSFDYEIEGKDWHHKGNNSKGEPMYEIWARR
ncbi:hypothetical protein [Poritiphilus flavus]|uniref:Membrane or secreted protein n=1 Tax=Poritiphilus flavus TaxID=2697053 RepID=A0A6L9E7Z5_9FLAO|nr:hypothetical protein [Poritiphilus flavus]NAS10732.1 hypothetical protein [Poritiphilus flavus]